MSYDKNPTTFSIQLFCESLGREIVLSRLKHPDILLVLLQIMKVLVETNEETEC